MSNSSKFFEEETIVFVDFITRPKKMQRSAEAQALVDEQALKLSLYQFYEHGGTET